MNGNTNLERILARARELVKQDIAKGLQNGSVSIEQSIVIVNRLADTENKLRHRPTPPAEGQPK